MPRICLLLTLCALGCGPGGGAPPAPDSCVNASTAGIDTLEIGAATSADLAGQPGVFMPLHDGDGMSLLRGGQGAYMLGFLFRVTPASAPSCLGQQTLITDTSGVRVTGSTVPLTTYAQPDGSRVTHPIWLPADYPSTFVVATTTPGPSLSLHLHLDLTK